MKNIEYFMKDKNLSSLKYSICRICYLDKHKIDCDDICGGCEFDIALGVFDYLNKEREVIKDE